MRRGCISLGDVQCDNCHRIIPNAERYLLIDEEGGKEAEKGKATFYCIECSIKKGYARYKGEKKDEKTLTFLEEEYAKPKEPSDETEH